MSREAECPKMASGNEAVITEVDPLFELKGRRVWIAGHRGMVGSAIIRRLARENCQVLTAGRETVDLRVLGVGRDLHHVLGVPTYALGCHQFAEKSLGHCCHLIAVANGRQFLWGTNRKN